MALFRQKESTTALYIAAREYMVAPLNFDSDWTEVRCGAFLSGCPANTEDQNAADASAGFQTENVDDQICFGLKNSTSAALPGEVGSLYLGIKNTGGLPFDNYAHWRAFNLNTLPAVPRTTIGDAFGRMSAVGYAGATKIDGGQIHSAAFPTGAILFKNYIATQGYCGLYVIKFVINNRGASSQTVSISIASKDEVPGIDYTPFALRQEMNNASFGPAATIAWNSGGSARDIPDSFYIRLPFYSNRLMIATMRAIKYQP